MSDVTDAADRLERLQRDARKRTPYDRVMRLPEEDIDIVIAAARERVEFEQIISEQAQAIIDAGREREDALAAVIEGEAEWWRAMSPEHAQHLMILREASLRRIATANTAEILRERDAEKWSEGYGVGVGHEILGRARVNPENRPNPYRKEAGE